MAAEINLTPTASYLEIAGGPGAAYVGNGAPNSSDGANSVVVPARTWGTPSECVAGAVLVHGLGAHSGWFEALGRRLKVRRIFAVAYDQVGFGKRRQEPFFSQSQWFNDLVMAFSHVRKMVGDKPIYVMGNSMGAAIALKVVCDQTISPAGLVMFSPGFDGHPHTFKLGYRLSAIVSALMHPETEIELPYTPEMVTRTEAVRNWLTNDPDRRFTPTGRMLLELLKLSFELPKLKSVSCPVMMLTAGFDNIVDGKVSRRIFERLQSPSKRERVFEEAWHDLMFDPVIDELVDEVAVWIANTSSIPAEKLRVY